MKVEACGYYYDARRTEAWGGANEKRLIYLQFTLWHNMEIFLCNNPSALAKMQSLLPHNCCVISQFNKQTEFMGGKKKS